MNNTICGYPWLGAAIRPNGNVIPCCQFAGKQSHISKDFRSEWQHIRDDMIAGKAIKGCEECYQKEASGVKSIRLASLEYFKPTTSEALPLVQLEVAFNNLCNLACVHCNSDFSTKWYSEDVLAGRAIKTGIIDNKFDYKSWDLTQLKSIKLIGGEPLMSQELCIELLKNCDLKNIRLFIATNGTIIMNDMLRELVSQCQHVTISVSLDSIGTVNDWYRWPSKFDDIVRNMKTYDSWWKDDDRFTPRVHPVINAHTVLYIDEYKKFMDEYFSHWYIDWDWIRMPAWQTIAVLPTTVKQELIKSLSDNVTIDRLNDTPSCTYNEFKEKTMKLAKERNLDFFAMVPKFKDIWNLDDTK